MRYVLSDGTRAHVHAMAASSFDAVDLLHRRFGVLLRYASARVAVH